MIRKFFIIQLFALATVAGTAAAQEIRPRIAGLENNERYMELLRDDARLQQREDSLVTAVNRMREAFRNGRNTQGLSTDDILALESGIFDVRNRRGRITSEISTIEQQWVIENLSSSAGGSQSEGGTALHGHGHAHGAASTLRVLTDHESFERMLPQQDYEALRRSRNDELHAIETAGKIRSLCDTLVDTAAEYAAAQDASTGIPLYDKFTDTQRHAAALAAELTAAWGRVLDCKNFAYDYLLEQMNSENLIERSERRFAERRATAAESYGKYASDALADFCLERMAMVEYEIAVAETLNMPQAADSLRRVLRNEAQFEYRIPKVEVQERMFLDYAGVEFSSPSIYSAQNPIPEVAVYERGKIYRVLLGTFWSKQAVSLFRGAAPLGWWQKDGKYLYFAGGFKSKSEAEAAAAELKAKGFKSPVVVVWRDGVYRNLVTDPEADKYRLDITGVQSLTDAVKAAIAETAPDCEVSRAGDRFVVGMFSDKADAQRTADAVRAAAEDIRVRIAGTEE